MQPFLTLLIATRDRPKRFENAINSALKTAKSPFLFMWYVDEDDPQLSEYLKLDYPQRIVGKSQGSAKALMQMLNVVETPFFMIGADDVEFQTEGWDEKFLNAMPKDQLAVIYGSDHAKQNCNHFFSSMKWHKLVGMWPDIFNHFGPDGWVAEVAKKCNRLIKVHDVVVEHLHYKYGKSEVDETYRRTRATGEGSSSLALIRSGFTKQQQAAETILKAIDEYQRKCA